MLTRTTQTFQEKVLSHMTFTPYPTRYCTLYKNEKRPELGYFIKYSRMNYYDLGIGDYTIPTDFSIAFEHQEELLRFGTVYIGETSFEIEDSDVSSFTPSSFLVVERALKGTQTWKKGTH